MNSRSASLSIGQCATLACLWEVSAPKVGNVNRNADFPDTTFYDFVTSAVIIGGVLENAQNLTVGETILTCVQKTREAVNSNTNLGIVLLLVPLAKIPGNLSLSAELPEILENLSVDDCVKTYQAIRISGAGGLKSVPNADVQDPPTIDLLSAMRLAEARDRIAFQYCHQFQDVFEFVVPLLLKARKCGLNIIDAIVHVQLQLLSEFPDSLITRKCGAETSEYASGNARQILQHAPGSVEYLRGLSDFDFWLRADANRRNPGTTADLITAGLFVALREGQLQPGTNDESHDNI